MRRRNHARFAADIEWFAVAALENSHDRAVAGDSAQRFRGEHRAILDLRRIVGIDDAVFEQRFRGSVHGELKSIGGVEAFFGFRRFGEKSFGENRERVGATNVCGRSSCCASSRSTTAAHEPVHRAIERLH